MEGWPYRRGTLKSFFVFSAFGLVLAVTCVAQTPVIRPGPDGIVNNASYAQRGLPNSGIAQGAIFAIFGDNLGPANLTTQPSYPLQKTLGGTSVKVTMGGTTRDAIPIYTIQGQVGAVLPSNTPLGVGEVTVTYNGQTSAPHGITVVANTFGIFALNQQGSGPASLTDANGGFITLTSAAKPGQTIVVWGTGLGAIATDDAADQSGGDLTNIPTQVLVGGKQATIRYHGRAPHIAGLDQLNVDIPAGVQGCYVSLIVLVNGMASNSTTLPVAPNGGTCSDANGLSSTDLSAFLGNSNGVRLGSILVGRSISQSSITLPPGVPVPPGFGEPTKSDDASALFVKYTPQQLTASQGLFRQASIGSCVVTTISLGAIGTVDPIKPVYLDAGAAITMTGGTTPQTLRRDAQFGFYSLPTPATGASSPTFIPDAGGTFNFSNAAGGADVGALQGASVLLGAPVVWTNMDQITNISRNSDLPITWSGGAAGTFVQISGTSIFSNGTANLSSGVIVGFSCTAPAPDHAFTVPMAVLLQLPPSTVIGSGGFSVPTGGLSVGNYSQLQKFTAAGLDVGYIQAYSTNTKSTNYQ
jgi:uncharacterized protein (TIGR03437 family)